MDTTGDTTRIIRTIAREETEQRAAVCAEKYGRVSDRMTALERAATENTTAITKMAEAVITLTATVAQVVTVESAHTGAISDHSTRIADHETRISVMAVKMGVAAGIVGSLPSIIRWAIEAFNH